MHLGRVSKLEGRMYHERQGRRVARARARGSCVMISMLAHGARVLHEERVAVGHVIQREQTDAHFAIHSNVRAARSARDGACGLSFEALSYMLLSTAWSSSHGSGPTVSMRRAHSLVKASAASVERK